MSSKQEQPFSLSAGGDEKQGEAFVRHGAADESSPFVAPRESAWALILEHTAKSLRRNGFGVSIAASLASAADLVMHTLLPMSGAESVSFGGSMTVREAGLLEALKARPELRVLDTFDASGGLEAMLELRRQALLSDLFLCSANALTREGAVIMVDGFGNRTAAVQFGPKKVILLVGRNKICDSVEAGIARIKGIAAPANGLRLNKNTPCTKTGRCMDCSSPERMCNCWSIIPRCGIKERIHVVLIDAEAGF
ncbi:lactate utilization protein [Desulfovibrio sp. OttesenSCG-928-A18]|nr:lactate utilization protein [Desulfovibrio sp. OttesenSCG-928-A18]